MNASGPHLDAPRLLMVMPYRQLVRKAKAQGFWVGAIWDPALQSASYLDDVRQLADAFVLTDFSDDAALRRTIHDTARRHDVATIYHIGREDSMVSTYEVAEELHAELNPAAAIRVMTDKQVMRERLAGHGLSAVSFAAAGTRREVPGAVARIGYPAVVKPTALAGSRGVFLLRSAADQVAWSELVDGIGYEGPFLVEEYLRGPEYSVETLSRDGRHHVVGITQKHLGPPPLFVEVGHLHPAPLPDGQRRAIEDLTATFLTVCGYRFGPAHTEVIWTSDGPRIVESQARLGGDRIPRLVELSTGSDLEQAVFSTMAGEDPPVAPHTATALVRFFTFPPGRVETVSGLDIACESGYVDELSMNLKPGDTASAVRDSRTRHGHVIVSGASPEQARQRCERVLATIRVVIDGVPVSADGRAGEPPRRGAGDPGGTFAPAVPDRCRPAGVPA